MRRHKNSSFAPLQKVWRLHPKYGPPLYFPWPVHRKIKHEIFHTVLCLDRLLVGVCASSYVAYVLYTERWVIARCQRFNMALLSHALCRLLHLAKSYIGRLSGGAKIFRFYLPYSLLWILDVCNGHGWQCRAWFKKKCFTCWQDERNQARTPLLVLSILSHIRQKGTLVWLSASDTADLSWELILIKISIVLYSILNC